MRIAFFGLGYHERTGSSRFFLDLLRDHAEVETFFAEADVDDLRRRCAGFDEDRYDAIVIWQLHEAFALLSGRHPNVTFAPMYDAMFRGGAFVWKPSFNAAKILCFSWAMRAEAMRRAPVHAHVQYAPDPARYPMVTDFSELRGFFWYRRRDIPPEAIFALTQGERFARLAVHDAPDPGHEASLSQVAPSHLGQITRTAWSQDRAAFDTALRGANVFFASRPLEGIGMSFLEAMACGLCVVAPDAPTMNEVISHGANGLLYSPGSRAPIDFRSAREIGARARATIEHARRRFDAAMPSLIDFVATPHSTLARHGDARGVLLPRLADLCPVEVECVAPGASLSSLRGSWIVVVPPGDVPDQAAMARALAAAPAQAAVIRGHILARLDDGSERMVRTAEFGAAWARMAGGVVTVDGPAGFGVPAATLLRADLLRNLDTDPPTTPAALCDLLLAARASGFLFHDAEEILAIHAVPADPGEGLAGWAALMERQEGPGAADRFRAAVAAAAISAARAENDSRAAYLVLALIARADAISPAFGHALERIVFGGLMRALRARLARLRPDRQNGAA